MSCELDRWQRKRGFYDNAPEWVHNIWRTRASLEWFLKSRRNELNAHGAIRKLGRDWFVDIERMKIFVSERLELGGKNAE